MITLSGSDTREFPSIKIIEELVENGALIQVYDPYVKTIKTRGGNFFSENFEKSLKWADCVIIVTNHDDFSFENKIINYEDIDKKIIIDSCNAFNFDKLINSNNFDYVKL